MLHKVQNPAKVKLDSKYNCKMTQAWNYAQEEQEGYTIQNKPFSR